jgi:hypothetical protein
MSEYDANQWLTQRVEPETVDPLEQTQRMPVAERRYRMAEAALMKCEEIARKITRPPGWQFVPVSAVLERKQYVDIKP